MCLGVPGRLLKVYQREGLRMGEIDFGGVTREVCLAYVPEAQPGEFVIIHVGFAISMISEEEAHSTLAMLREIMDLEDEIGPEAVPG